MSPLVNLPNDFEDGVDTAFGSEVRANDDAIVQVVNGGLDYQNVAPLPDFPGSVMTTTPGRRLVATNLEDDAVDSRVLKDDPSAGSPLAAVGSSDHLKDGIVTKAKVAASTLTFSQMDILAQTTAFNVTLSALATPITVAAPVTNSGLLAVGVERRSNAGNFEFIVTATGASDPANTITSARTANIAPGTPIPSANYALIGLYLANVAYNAGTTNLTGDIISLALRIA